LEKDWWRSGETSRSSHIDRFTKTSQVVHTVPTPGGKSAQVLARRLAAVPLSLALAASLSPPAGAAIASAQTIDGPSADILEVGGVAMAEDGTGGVVYRKREGGRPHIFAAQLVDGRWRAPQRVDAGQGFESSWPRIAAGDGGRLVVTWVQEFGVNSDRLFSAALDPGARRFQAPIPIDFNVGEATATYPSLAMNRGGVAYIVYRVLTGTTSDPSVPPGYVRGEYRVARFGGTFWSTLGAPVNRNSNLPYRIPTPENAPRIGVDVSGNAILAFQEPDDEFVDRIWARRVFGASPGIPLLVSPQSWGGRPLRGPADQLALEARGFGQAAIAFRQQPGEGGALRGTRVLVNTIPESFSEEAGAFKTARLADGGGDGGPAGVPGSATVAVTPAGAFLVGFGLGNASLVAAGDDQTVGAPERVDDGRTSVPGDPAVTLAPSGAAAVAWKVRSGGRGGVAVREVGADGVADVQTVAAVRGGPVNELHVAGSGLGDAAVAFQQGTSSAAQIGATFVDAPPGLFGLESPIGFRRVRRLRLRWDRPPEAFGPLTYSVTVDDEVVADDLRVRSILLGPRDLPDGVHDVKVVARDGAEQETTSTAADVRIDRRAPRLVVRRLRGRRLRVDVTDGRRGQVSGVLASATRITLGGRTVRRRTRVIRRVGRGRWRVTVRTRDRVGNRATLRRTVRVR
jgi:hypothetical protein